MPASIAIDVKADEVSFGAEPQPLLRQLRRRGGGDPVAVEFGRINAIRRRGFLGRGWICDGLEIKGIKSRPAGLEEGGEGSAAMMIR